MGQLLFCLCVVGYLLVGAVSAGLCVRILDDDDVGSVFFFVLAWPLILALSIPISLIMLMSIIISSISGKD